jgi:hypothetical protein
MLPFMACNGSLFIFIFFRDHLVLPNMMFGTNRRFTEGGTHGTQKFLAGAGWRRVCGTPRCAGPAQFRWKLRAPIGNAAHDAAEPFASNVDKISKDA